MDIQFKGGAMLTYSYTGELDISAVQKDIESTLGSNVTLQTGSSIASDAQTLTISMPGTQTVETATVEALSVRLEENYSDNSFRQLSLNVDPTIGKVLCKSIVAVVADAVDFGHIAVRFKKIGRWPATATVWLWYMTDRGIWRVRRHAHPPQRELYCGTAHDLGLFHQ
ncbi:MAG: hypothetical protein ACLR7U_07970 [Ruthenibacterium lactatiformans]